MKLKIEDKAAIADLTASQIRALTAVFNEVIHYLGEEVLKCSLGEQASSETERRVVNRKHRYEGAISAQLAFNRELQNIRKETDAQVADLTRK